MTEARRVERRDPVRAVREVEARAEEVVAVARDLRQDLTEAERDDREVVAAQSQGRQADDDAGERGDDAGEREQKPHSDVDARQIRWPPDGAEMQVLLWKLQRREPRRGIGAHRIERDV